MSDRLRFRVDPRDAPAEKAAEKLGLSMEQFEGRLQFLLSEDFPGADSTTGMFDMQTIDAWLALGRPLEPPPHLEPWERAQKVDNGACPGSLLYFISAAKAVKIGISRAPTARLKDLQSSHYEELSILGTMQGGPATERALHEMFEQYRIRGEWFHRCEAIECFVRRHCSV